MAKIGDSKKKEEKLTEVEYPQGYYEGAVIKHEFQNKIKVNGKLLLIHISNLLMSFWRIWPEVKCRYCFKPFKVAVILVPLDSFDDEWYFAGERFAGGYPQCFCDPEKKHYLNTTKIIGGPHKAVEEDDIKLIKDLIEPPF